MGKRYNIHLDESRMALLSNRYGFFLRRIIGWAMDKRMTKELVILALRRAIWRQPP